ncbi:hypothetical protein EDC94DRAFT_509418, partial [Helicostylum pulchrum]
YLRDAWKKLEGISIMEARHIYVEALLRMATQAYQKNIGKKEAQQIIQTFAAMRPFSEEEEDDGDDDTDDTSNQDGKVFIYIIRPSPVFSKTTNNRPSSVSSVQTMFTAPSTPPRQSPMITRPTSVNARSRLGQNKNSSGGYEKRSHHMMRNDLDVSPNNVSQDVNDMTNRDACTPTSTILGHNNQNQSRYINDTTFFNLPPPSAVTLGPATKKALDALQNEVIALNDRINDLRRELVKRDKQHVIKKKPDVGNKSNDKKVGGWHWIIKTVAKYAGVNLMTATILFFILYKIGRPVAYATIKTI